MDSKASTLEEALQVPMAEGSTEEYIKAMCSSIGENMALRKFARLTADGIGAVVSYIHMGGKVGVLLSIKAGKEETVKSDAFKALAKDLTLHIAAAAPKSVSSDSLDPAFVAEEQEIAKQQLIQEGKPEHLLEKILPGKLKALYAQSCLLNQVFVKDPAGGPPQPGRQGTRRRYLRRLLRPLPARCVSSESEYLWNRSLCGERFFCLIWLHGGIYP